MGQDRALIFDFDGLVVATEDLYADALVEEMAARGVDVAMADIAHLFGSTGPENEAMWDALLAAWGAGLDLDALEDRIRDRVGTGFDELEVLPGVVELLDAADEAGWRTALATGKARWRLDEHLARLGIGPRFEVIVTAEEVRAGKPAPDIFVEAARRLGVAPGGCVVLEDSLPGCLGAQAAGMVTVACPSRVTESVELPAGVRRVSSLLDVRLDELPAPLSAGSGDPDREPPKGGPTPPDWHHLSTARPEVRPGGDVVARMSLHAPEAQSVTFVELFFDLVFVYAVTQLTVVTAADLTWSGVGRALVVFWLIWWAWTQFTWSLNPADTTHGLVRLGVLIATVAALVMAASVPEAYGGAPLWFAGPYVVVRLLGLALQLGVDRDRSHTPVNAAVSRFALGSAVALAVVLAGAAADPSVRVWIWALAVAGDLLAARSAGSQGAKWDIHTAHFTERHGLFVIIALGESVIIAAGALASEERTTELVAVTMAAVVVVCLLWWTYFAWLKEALEEGLERAGPARVGVLARDAYSLGHFGLVAGIVAVAVAVEEIIHHPTEAMPPEVALALGVGVALFVGFSSVAHWRVTGHVLVARSVALVTTLVGLALTAALSPWWPLLVVVAGLAAVVVAEERPWGRPGPDEHRADAEVDHHHHESVVVDG